MPTYIHFRPAYCTSAIPATRSRMPTCTHFRPDCCTLRTPAARSRMLTCTRFRPVGCTLRIPAARSRMPTCTRFRPVGCTLKTPAERFRTLTYIGLRPYFQDFPSYDCKPRSFDWRGFLHAVPFSGSDQTHQRRPSPDREPRMYCCHSHSGSLHRVSAPGSSTRTLRRISRSHAS